MDGDLEKCTKRVRKLVNYTKCVFSEGIELEIRFLDLRYLMLCNVFGVSNNKQAVNLIPNGFMWTDKVKILISGRWYKEWTLTLGTVLNCRKFGTIWFCVNG